MECIAGISRFDGARQSIDRAADAWLACYPFFQDALRRGESIFGVLPGHARTVVLNRVTVDLAQRVIASKTLDEVRVSFIELPTDSVSDVVQRYLYRQEAGGNVRGNRLATSLQDMLPSIPPLNYSPAARPPCLLRPGSDVFIDGWMRFFSYTSRGDPTIPLLAVDWLDFHDRLGTPRDSVTGPHICKY